MDWSSTWKFALVVQAAILVWALIAALLLRKPFMFLVEVLGRAGDGLWGLHGVFMNWGERHHEERKQVARQMVLEVLQEQGWQVTQHDYRKENDYAN